MLSGLAVVGALRPHDALLIFAALGPLAGVIFGMRRAPGKPNNELVEPGSHHDTGGHGLHLPHRKGHGDRSATSVRESSSGKAETDLGPDPSKGSRRRR